jgi:hypothetical protein
MMKKKLKMDDFEKWAYLRSIHDNLIDVEQLLRKEGAVECARLLSQARGRIAEVGFMCKSSAEGDDPDRYGQ